MATIKVACPKCGQKVSGDESFHGSVVECPICSSDIHFPKNHRHEPSPDPFSADKPVPKENKGDSSPPVAAEGRQNAHAGGTWEEVSGNLAASPPPAPEKQPSSPSEPVGTARETADVPPSPIFGAISLVSAVLSVVTCVGGVLFAPIAIIFGHTAMAKARNSPVHPAPGQTLGAIGLMIGYVSLVITILVLLVLVFFGDAIREALQNAA